MTDTAITIMMWIGGGILTLLFFFASFYFNRSIKAYDDLSASVNKLQLTLTGLNGIILSIQEKNDMLQGSCKDRHSIVDTRLNEHSKRLDEHDKQITRLEVKTH
jgi:hypothetical protein